MKNRGASKSWWSKKTKAAEMCALKFCVLLMFVSGKCCAIVVFFSPTKSWFLRQTHVVVPTFQSWFVLVSVTSCQIQNKICERARGAPHEHKLLANDFMGSTLGFVKMQCPQLTDAQTQGRCIACLIICAYFYYCIDFVCKVTFVLSEKLCTEKVANNHSRYFFIKVISICEVAKLVNASKFRVLPFVSKKAWTDY